MIVWIIFILSLIASTMITNVTQRLYMKMMGASGMFFSMKKKLIAIIIIALILAAIVIQILGIEIPK